MKLDRQGREFYDLTLTTTPPVTGWQASFDGGTTWLAGEALTVDPDGNDLPDGAVRARWLVGGPTAEAGSQVATISTSGLRPKLKADEDPEDVVRKGPPIYLA